MYFILKNPITTFIFFCYLISSSCSSIIHTDLSKTTDHVNQYSKEINSRTISSVEEDTFQGKGVFGSVEIPVGKNSNGIFSRWKEIQDSNLELCCDNSQEGADRISFFKKYIEQTKTLSFHAKLNFINRLVNQYITYAREKDDIWSPPNETLNSGIGDCEDLAVLKMALLKEVGIPIETMSLVIIKRSKEGKPDHAILTVHRENKNYVLDNMITEYNGNIPKDSEIDYYQPVISIRQNKEKQWDLLLHGFKTGHRFSSKRE